MNSFVLANRILHIADRTQTDVILLKLQKTLYYAQGYFLRFFSEPAFKDEILHWAYGPACPSVHFAFSCYGAEPLSPKQGLRLESMTIDTGRLLEKVTEACLAQPTKTLIRMTCQEAPWLHTKLHDEIPTQSIRAYFADNDPLKLLRRN